jgi:hypothetical protein
MTTAAAASPKLSGGAFLIEELSSDQTAEDLSEEHLAIARTVDEFWANDIEPHLEAIRQQKPGIALTVLRKSADLGLTAVAIPERFGGMAMDLASVMIVGEHLGRDASYPTDPGTRRTPVSARSPSSSLEPKSKNRSICLGWRRPRSWQPML